MKSRAWIWHYYIQKLQIAIEKQGALTEISLL